MPRSHAILLGAARHYFGARRTLAVLAIIAVAAGIALNWSWLATAGIAPILLTLLPCLVMCGAGLCMSKMMGGSCEQPTTPSRDAAEAATSAAAFGVAKTDRLSV